GDVVVEAGRGRGTQHGKPADSTACDEQARTGGFRRLEEPSAQAGVGEGADGEADEGRAVPQDGFTVLAQRIVPGRLDDDVGVWERRRVERTPWPRRVGRTRGEPRDPPPRP